MKIKSKLFLFLAAFLLMIPLCGAVNNNAKANALPTLLYKSNGRHDNVYYRLDFADGEWTSFEPKGKHKNQIKYWYGRMPSYFRRKGFIYSLYPSAKTMIKMGLNRKIVSFPGAVAGKVLHRHGQTYYPVYTEPANERYVSPNKDITVTANTNRIHGKKYSTDEVFVNSKDLGKRLAPKHNPYYKDGIGNRKDAKLYNKLYERSFKGYIRKRGIPLNYEPVKKHATRKHVSKHHINRKRRKAIHNKLLREARKLQRKAKRY